MRSINGLDYRNTGDWVESRTALVEEFDGTLRLLQFTQSGDLLRELAVSDDEPGPQVQEQTSKVLEPVA
jgi:hypothetical protein